MKKIIVYGYGSRFQKEERLLRNAFEILAITGKDSKEAILLKEFKSANQIQNLDYDFIIIASSYQAEIANYLIDELNIDKSKISLDEMALNNVSLVNGQYQDDAILCMFCQAIGLHPKDIYYLELGTNHPIHINNTYLFYQLGAEGVLVEPNKKLHNLIQLCRPRDTLIKAAVGTSSMEKSMLYHDFKSSALGTLVKEKLNESEIKNIEEFTECDEYMVNILDINTILKNLKRVPDILSIDIEGLDYDVITNIDYNKFKPTIIIVELLALGAKKQYDKEIIQFLEYQSYTLVNRQGCNGIFIYKDFVIKNLDFFSYLR